MSNKFLHMLRREAGSEAKIFTKNSLLHIYSFDQSDLPGLVRFFLRTRPDFVFQPHTSNALKTFMILASKEGIPVVPRGSGSWGLGGCLAPIGGAVVDLSFLSGIIEVNEAEQYFTAQAGAKWFEADAALAHFGLGLKAHPTSWFSTIGGWLSTGGVGVGSLKYGHFSNQVRFVEFLTANGETLKVERGDESFPLLFGSEGQLGIVKTISVSAMKREKPWMVAASFAEPPDAMGLIDELLKNVSTVTDARLIDGIRLAQLDLYSGDRLFGDSSVLFVQGTGEGLDETRRIIGGSSNISELEGYKAQFLWHEMFSPLKAKRLGPGIVAVSLVVERRNLCELLALFRDKLEGVRMGFDAYFGPNDEAHVMGFLPVGQPSSPGFLLSSVIPYYLTGLGLRLGARPYGIGLWNAPFLTSSIGNAELERLRKLKLSFDPHAIMNPGKFLTVEKLEPFWRMLFSTTSAGLFSMIGRGFIHAKGIASSPGETLELARRFPRSERSDLKYSTLLCSRCGSCVPVCPAYLLTGDEMVSAKGKLMVSSFSMEEELFQCMHCKACTDVCQSALRLEDAWNELELSIEKERGRPFAEIEDFVKRIEEAKIMERPNLG
ncbi:MAG: FAD-binding protein [Candidatus Eisenbacteria bacterium]|nr:FAD-binding protein [Candidatus Eisenbacteria bacterium]